MMMLIDVAIDVDVTVDVAVDVVAVAGSTTPKAPLLL